MRVSLVRVDSEWHVFLLPQDAWSFYEEWRDYRDCECLLDCYVNEDARG